MKLRFSSRALQSSREEWLGPHTDSDHFQKAGPGPGRGQRCRFTESDWFALPARSLLTRSSQIPHEMGQRLFISFVIMLLFRL